MRLVYEEPCRHARVLHTNGSLRSQDRQLARAQRKAGFVSANFHISVIDDDDGVRWAVGSLLQSYGYDASAFNDVDTFFDSTFPGASDCIVSDIQMPGRSGLDLCRELRRRNIFTPVIIISAMAPYVAQPKVAEAGAYAYLEKPFKADTLLTLVREAVSGTEKPRRVAGAK